MSFKHRVCHSDEGRIYIRKVDSSLHFISFKMTNIVHKKKASTTLSLTVDNITDSINFVRQERSRSLVLVYKKLKSLRHIRWNNQIKF